MKTLGKTLAFLSAIAVIVFSTYIATGVQQQRIERECGYEADKLIEIGDYYIGEAEKNKCEAYLPSNLIECNDKYYGPAEYFHCE